MQPDPLEHAELFAADREWLSRQQGMSHFQHGCAELVAQMNAWIKECVAEICGESIDSRVAQHAGYLHRVWGCWRNHWKKAADASPGGLADRHAVADVIHGQRPAAVEDKAGADLIRDVVLVEAVLTGSEPAIAYFDRVHGDLVNRLVARFDPSLQSDRSWWQDTKSRLFGTPVKDGQLKGFAGAGSLHSFMDTAIRRDLCRANKKIQRERENLKTYGEGIVGIDNHTPAADATTRDCHALFRDAWRKSLDDSPHEDRAVAKLVLVNGLSVTEAAAVLKKNKGTISRTLGRVYGRFRAVIYQPDGDFLPVYHDCGEHLFAERANAQGLLQELFREETVQEAQP